QGGGGGVEVFEGALPAGALDEVAGVGEEDELPAGARQRQDEVLRMLAERHGAVRMAARHADEDYVEFALAESFRQAERRLMSLQQVRTFDQLADQLYLSLVEGDDGDVLQSRGAVARAAVFLEGLDDGLRLEVVGEAAPRQAGAQVGGNAI